jgi:hypothetical protein
VSDETSRTETSWATSTHSVSEARHGTAMDKAANMAITLFMEKPLVEQWGMGKGCSIIAS